MRMRKKLNRIIAVLLCAVMLLQVSDGVLAFAAEDPTERIPLSIPESQQDGGNHFFIREERFQISEKSHEKLYIPIQRVGAVDQPAEVTLKVADFTAHYGVNYTAKIRGEKLEPEVLYEGVAVVDITRYAEELEEIEDPDAAELGQTIHDAGGADMVNTAGQTVGRLNAVPLDENGSPIEAETTPAAEAPEAQSAAPGEIEEIEPEIIGRDSPTGVLRAARNNATGTASDRQELSAPEELLPGMSGQTEAADEEADLVENSYPGREYRLSFATGETVKFLEITPRYSPEADGDCTVILMLKDEPLEYFIDRSFNERPVIITDEDPRTNATIRMASEEVLAENGSVTITVQREGRINDVVGVMLSSSEGSAEMGEDYGGVGAKLYFPMGVMQRSVELPVGHGTVEKDFYVSISPLGQEEIGLARTHVIIPAAEAPEEDAELMESSPYEAALNLQELEIETQRSRWWKGGETGYENSGTYYNDGLSYTGRSVEDNWSDDISTYGQSCGYVAFRLPKNDLEYTYAYDGVHICYDFFTNWADGLFKVAQWNYVPSMDDYRLEKNLYTKNYGDCSNMSGQTADVYFDAEKQPAALQIACQNLENHYSPFRDCHVQIWINSVERIKRSFSVMIDPADPLPFVGVDEKTERDRVKVMTDGTNDAILDLYAFDTFSISKPIGQNYTRLKDIVAVSSSGTEYSLSDYIVDNTENGVSYVAGLSDTFDVTLSEHLLQFLGDFDCISWNRSKGSISGVIHLKPVFDYSMNVIVDVKDGDFGELYLDELHEEDEAIRPTLLWDFNADGFMDDHMGEAARESVHWNSAQDADGNDYYTFTAEGGDPFVSIDLTTPSVSKISWAKVRARNRCGAEAIELYGHTGGRALTGAECTHVDLEKDAEWHTYIINIPEENVRTANAYKQANLTETCWRGTVDWIRLDPMWRTGDGGMNEGDQIDIDYVAFFSTKEEAEGFRPDPETDPRPVLLWDFNSDERMSADMGQHAKDDVLYWGQYDEAGNNYYIFAATGNDPRVSIDMDCASAAEMTWAKVRAKNIGAATAIELFGAIDSDRISQDSLVHLDLERDEEWHEYIINLPAENIRTRKALDGVDMTKSVWNGKVNYIRLDPLWAPNQTPLRGSEVMIDYVAFFSTRQEAEAYAPQIVTNRIEPGIYTFRLGDELIFRQPPEKVNGFRGCGVGYVSRINGSAGTLFERSECEYYVDGRVRFSLETDYYQFWPVFTADDNTVRVQVPTEKLRFFHTDMGLFKDVTPYISGEYTVFPVKETVLTNELMELTAVVNNASCIPIWTLGTDKTVYSGETFYFYTDATAEENTVTLTVDAEADDHADYSLMGTIYTAVMNLATGLPSDARSPAADAGVLMGPSGAATDEDGRFTLKPQLLVGGTWVRYLISYNGIVSLKETKLAPATAPTQTVTFSGEVYGAETAEAIPVTVGAIRAQTNAAGGARFTYVEVEQVGVLQGILNVVELNGQKLTIKLHVDPGPKYVFNDEVYDEQIMGVRLYFQSQLTGAIHGAYSTLPEDNEEDGEEETPKDKDKTPVLTWDPETNIATLHIEKFSPEDAEDYASGDVLMAQLITDKKTVKTVVSEQNMYYDPVSAGIAVITDRDYVPETFSYELDVPTLLNASVDDDGNLIEGERRSFGRFPFLGEITTVLRVFTLFKQATRSDRDYGDEGEEILDALEELADASADAGGGELMWNPLAGKEFAMSALVRIKDLPYGGQRIMFAVVATTAVGSYKSVLNPKATKQYYSNMLFGYGKNEKKGDNEQSKSLIFNGNSAIGRSAYRHMRSEMSGPYGRFSLYVGIYFDFGYIEIKETDGGGTHLSHDLIFMGAGGFVGGQVAFGWTWQIFPFCLPVFLNLEGNVGATLFLGAEANPEMTLANYGTTVNHAGDDFHFSLELLMQGSLSFTGGLGLYKTLGIRITISVGVEAGYNRLMPTWYQLSTDWGFTTNFTISGGIDFNAGPVAISLDLASFSFPLPFGYGFMEFAVQARRAAVLLTTLYTKMDDVEASDEVVKTMWKKMIALGDAVDHYTVSEMQLKRLVNELKDYAYDNDYLGLLECGLVNAVGSTGPIVNLWSTLQLTDWDDLWYKTKTKAIEIIGDIGGIVSRKSGPSYGAALLAAADAQEMPETDAPALTARIPAPVDARWVADEGELMAAFGAVSSKQLMEDAIQHPNSRIMPLRYESGGVTHNSNQFLLVFLSQTENQTDGTHPDVLMYSIYDANTDTWTEPRQIQPDGIQDGKPCLVDAGDRLILTWASVSGKNYEAFKAFAAEKGLSIEEAALQYPIEAGKGQEIYAAEFSKASKTFGPIEQLTDDSFCDSYPQAVYDSVSGDYIVLYYKTAQDAALYDDPTQAIVDTASAGPDPEKTYSVLCYMLYNARADQAEGYRDDSGTACDVPAGWVRDCLYANEFDESMKDYQNETGETTGLAGFLADYGGQRFLPSSIPAEDAEDDPVQTDPPITDLTVCEGYNGYAAFAFTADMDLSLDTADDRDLFVQFYRFSDHSIYVPVKIAGEQAQRDLLLNGDRKTGHYELYDVQTEVNVGSPRLIRNGGSTWLFWREAGDSLKYLNISRLLKYKVLDGEDEEVLALRKMNEDGGYYFTSEDQAALSQEGNDHNVYAVREDGSFAIDAMTGLPYTPEILTVDFGTILTDPAINITEYDVISDREDNLYVVWSDTTRKDENAAIASCDESMALELYATAMVKQEDADMVSARWSKPYRLTRDNTYNDGVALALSDSGDLLIVHNQYRKLPIDTEEKLLELVASGERTVVNIDGEDYIRGSYYYDSPTSLMLTRFEPVGSAEATQFVFSDDTPVAGQTVVVSAVIENTGLTTAKGYDVIFNECRDGTVTRRIRQKSVDTSLAVNTGKKMTFEWTVPADGPDGYSIQAVISEKNGEASFAPVTTSSEIFVSAPAFELDLKSCVQNGDEFDAIYTVTNTGNKPAEDGTEANLYLQGLYGDLKEKYGVDDDCLIREDISGLQPGEVRTIERSFTLPVSVFRYCGYDAVQAVVYDSSMNDLEHTDHVFITLDEPLHLTLNGGQDVNVATGSTVLAPAIYESTIFMDIGKENAAKVVYTVDDPSIAAVDDEGKVTGLSVGTTTLTATLLPSGRTKSVRVKVDTGCKRDEDCPISQFTDAQPTAWYHDGVHWALEQDVMNGVGNGRFAPDSSTTRAMIVTMLWRMEDEPASGYAMTFQDVPDGKWYTEAIAWAAEQELVKGYSAEKFGPDDDLTREQLVTILERYAKYKGMDVSEGEKSYLIGFTDANSISAWAVKAFRWAVDAGIIRGVSSDRLSPKTDATRAQVATMLKRFDDLPEEISENKPVRRTAGNSMPRAVK